MSDQQLRLLVCGDRNWTDRGLIGDWLLMLRGDNPNMLLCHGAARGADTIAGEEAAKLDIPAVAFPAQWDRFGKRAGLIRNRQMLTEFRPTDVLAFHNLLAHSKGTKDMMTAARAAGIPVLHVTTACPTGRQWEESV